MRGAKIVSLALSAVLITGMMGVAGCGTRTDNTVRTQNVRQNRMNNTNTTLPQTNRFQTRSVTDGRTHQIQSLKYSPTLSNKVAQLRDVQSAHVVVTDRDAYVAVSLHGRGTTTNYNMQSTGITGNRGMMGTRGMTGTTGTTGIGTTGTTETGMGTGTTGTTGTSGMVGTPGYHGTGSGIGTDITRSGGYIGTAGTTRRDGYGVRGQAPLATSPLGTGGAFDGLTGGRNNRVGTLSRNQNQAPGTGMTNNNTAVDHVPQTVKDEISRMVKKTAPHIQNVYVSGHPEFVNQVGTYASNTRTGATLRTYTRDFESLVNRIFPFNTTGPRANTPAPTGVNRMVR